MPQEYESSAEMKKPLEVVGVIFIANNESAEVVEPREEALNFPASFVSPEWSTILRRNPPALAIWSNDLDSILLGQVTVQPVTVVRPCPR